MTKSKNRLFRLRRNSKFLKIDFCFRLLKNLSYEKFIQHIYSIFGIECTIKWNILRKVPAIISNNFIRWKFALKYFQYPPKFSQKSKIRALDSLSIHFFIDLCSRSLFFATICNWMGSWFGVLLVLALVRDILVLRDFEDSPFGYNFNFPLTGDMKKLSWMVFGINTF